MAAPKIFLSALVFIAAALIRLASPAGAVQMVGAVAEPSKAERPVNRDDAHDPVPSPFDGDWNIKPFFQFQGIPVVKGYYLRPVIGGYKSQGIHDKNGVDLAHQCGVPVMAAAMGTVDRVYSKGWNGGYGHYVTLIHPNGTKTLYAHLDQILVTPGQSVGQGVTLGLMGSTGNSTGCHVHFEVSGGKNPF